MKNIYLIITLLLSSMMFGQTTVFNDATADGKWSTAGNWTNGIPDETFTYGQLNNNVNLDVTTSILQLRSNASTLTGAGKITFTGTGVALLSTGANFTYNGSAEINGSNAKTLQVNNTSTGTYRQLTLGPLSVLTLTTLGRVVTQFDSKVVFQGTINGADNLQFAGNVQFDAGSDNTAFDGDMVWLGSGIVLANTTGDGAFLKAGSKIQVNNPGGILTLNGANSCDGNINVGGTNDFVLNINANQESFGTVGVGDGTLTINVDAGVSNLSFADSAGQTWGTTGSVVITGYESGEIRFGTSNTALTTQQLSQINADGIATGQALGLDANGYLVLESSLSVEDFGTKQIKPTAYPTLATNKLYFRTPQNDVKILGLSGNVLLSKKFDNQSEITINKLSPGLYFIVFDNQKVQKFIKK